MRGCLALVIALGLSGCLQDNDPLTTDQASPAPVVEEAPQPLFVPAGQAQASDASVSGVSVTDTTAFHWALRSSAPLFVVEFVWDLGDDNDCSFLDAASAGPTLGPNDLSIRSSTYGYGWGKSSGGELASAHAGPVDTRSTGGTGASASRTRGPMSGQINLTWMLANPQAEDESFFRASDVSAAISVTCDNPFSLISAREGRVVHLLDEGNLANGAGAQVFLAGSAGVADTASGESASAEVHMASASFGTHAAQVDIDAPGAPRSWLHVPTSPVSFGQNFFQDQDVAGTYVVTVDRAGAYFEAFWVAVWDITGPLTTGEFLAESIIDDPFE